MSMHLYGPPMALVYLALQVSVFFWPPSRWRQAGQVPLWCVGAAMVGLVTGGALGGTLAPVILTLSVPLGAAYLVVLWGAFLLMHRPARHPRPSIAPPQTQTINGTGATAKAMVKIVHPGA